MLDEDGPQVMKWGNHRIINYSEELRSIATDMIQAGKADGISICPRKGFSGDSLDFVRNIEGVRIVILQGLPDISLDTLQDLPELVEISMSETKSTLDLGRFPSLVKLSSHWHKKLFKNPGQSKIRALRLYNYGEKGGSLSDFSYFPDLTELEMIQGKFRSLSGISKYKSLDSISLHYCSKLEKIEDLSMVDLRSFFANVCKKILDHEFIGGCKNLEKLKLNECGSMQSLNFINSLVKLRSFRFLKTDVIDGDLSPLLRLDDVFFTEKRHFSYKNRDMKQANRIY